jgi:hypothetical protein
MVQTLHRFAACRDYRLAAAFAPEFTQAHYYYVRQSWMGGDAFAHALRSTPYFWSGTAVVSTDLTALESGVPAACQ